MVINKSLQCSYGRSQLPSSASNRNVTNFSGKRRGGVFNDIMRGSDGNDFGGLTLPFHPCFEVVSLLLFLAAV